MYEQYFNFIFDNCNDIVIIINHDKKTIKCNNKFAEYNNKYNVFVQNNIELLNNLDKENNYIIDFNKNIVNCFVKIKRIEDYIILYCSPEKITHCDKLIAHLSHEIRTPLNGIYGILNLLKETNLNKEQEEYVSICINSANSLVKILNDMLFFSKSKNNLVILEGIPFELDLLVEDAICLMSSNIKNKKEIDICYIIEENVPNYVIGDPLKLKQILTNLLSNSIKFTNKGEIKTIVSLYSAEPLLIKFDVIDTGIGMTEKQIEILFKPFVQGDDSISRKYGGTGLGMTICESLIKLYNGSISVNSTINIGTTISFFIKLTKNEYIAEYDHIPQNHLNKLKKQSIYIIDDNKTNCLFIESLLKKYTNKIKFCTDPQEGTIEIINNYPDNKWDILILDYNMPILNGKQVIEMLDEKGIKIKIFTVCSGIDKNKLLKLPNVHASLNKPIKKKLFMNMLFYSVIGLSQQNIKKKVIQKFNIDNLNILVVEDNKINGEILQNFLNKQNYNSYLVTNGADALDTINNKVFDIILMDLHMPILDGIETTKIIRNNYNIPIIAISADILKETKEQCFSIGINYFIEKPVNFDKLNKVITQLVNNNNYDIINVLIVDDEEINIYVMKKIIENISNKIIISTASNGKEALDKISLLKFDIVFTDINMNETNGISLMKITKKKHKDIEFIAVTGETDENIHVDYLNYGFDYILPKPVDKNLIKEIITNITSPKKIFSEEQLEEIKKDSPDIYEKIINIFLDSLNFNMNDIDILNTLHSIKGSSYQIGANLLGNICSELESYLRTNNKKELEDYQIQKLNKILNKTKKYLYNIIKK